MKKRVWAILTTLLCSCFLILQADEVKVTMKSGSTIIGELKELVATDHITIIVAGIESIINMSDVESVEKVTSINPSNKIDIEYGIYEITDKKQYPDSIIIKIANQDITMLLVRGGWFNMGYDGRHSLSWNSEPIHRVNLSSYYVSTQLISQRFADKIINPKVKETNDNPFVCAYRKDVDKVVSALITEVDMPLRLMTEAEWEYAALMPYANKIFWFSNCLEWCSDFWGDYEKEEQTNPQGPPKGNTYVLRSYSADNKKWCRTRSAHPSISTQADKQACIRIAISADKISF